jgi:hypothetical protein
MSLIYILLLSNILIVNARLLSSNSSQAPLATIIDQNSTRNQNFSNCFLFDMTNWFFYDLNVLSPQEGQPEFNYTIDENTTIFFNLCNNTFTKCNETESMVVLKQSSGGCRNLAYNKDTMKQWSYRYSHNYKYLNLHMQSPLPCDSKFNFSTVFHIECDGSMRPGELGLNDERNFFYKSDFKNIGYEDVSHNFNSCEKRIYFKSKAACPNYNIYPHWKFSLEYEYIFGMTFILFGVFLAFFGFHNYFVTIYILAFFYFFITSNLVFLFLNFELQYYSLYWIVMSSFILIGTLLAHFILKYDKLKIFILSIESGVCLSHIFYYLALSRIKLAPLEIFFSNILCWVSVAALLYFCLKQCTCLVLTTSGVGSFLVVRVIYIYLLRAFQCMREVFHMRHI